MILIINHSDSWTATFTDLSNGNGQGKGVTYRAYAIVTKDGVTYTVYGAPETKYARDLIAGNVKDNTSINLNPAKLEDNSSTKIEIAVGETKTLDGFTVKESLRLLLVKQRHSMALLLRNQVFTMFLARLKVLMLHLLKIGKRQMMKLYLVLQTQRRTKKQLLVRALPIRVMSL